MSTTPVQATPAPHRGRGVSLPVQGEDEVASHKEQDLEECHRMKSKPLHR